MESLARYLIEHALEIRLVTLVLLTLGFIGAAYFFSLLDSFFDKRKAARKAGDFSSSKTVAEVF